MLYSLYAFNLYRRTMTDQEQAMYELDYGIGMHVNSLVMAMGMDTENKRRIAIGEPIKYGEVEFEKLLIDNGTTHNSIIGRWFHK